MSIFKYKYPDGMLEIDIEDMKLEPGKSSGQRVNQEATFYKIDGGGWVRLNNYWNLFKTRKICEKSSSIKDFLESVD